MLIGAYEVAEDYYIQSNNLRGMDTQICDFYNFMGDFQTSIDNAIAYYMANSSDLDVIHLLANIYLQLRDFEKSLEYFREFRKHMERLGWMQRYNLYREGFVLVQLGHKEEGMELIERQLAFLDKQRTLQRASPHDYHYAAIYAFQGDYESALKHLRNYNKKELGMEIDVPFIPISYTQYDILFENLWDNEEFKVFIKEIDEEKAAIRAQVQEMMDKGDIGL
jgi:tetratricopeptide (TPR) repeat protein